MQTESSKDSACVQLHSQEVHQDWGQDCVPGFQLHPRDDRRNYGQDWAPGVQLYPQDVRQNHGQEVQLYHSDPRDICQSPAQLFPQLDQLRPQSVFRPCSVRSNG